MMMVIVVSVVVMPMASWTRALSSRAMSTGALFTRAVLSSRARLMAAVILIGAVRRRVLAGLPRSVRVRPL